MFSDIFSREGVAFSRVALRQELLSDQWFTTAGGKGQCYLVPPGTTVFLVVRKLLRKHLVVAALPFLERVDADGFLVRFHLYDCFLLFTCSDYGVSSVGVGIIRSSNYKICAFFFPSCL